MWARIVECMIGCWLLMSPFIFRHQPGETAMWANDLTVGAVLVVLSLASYWRPTEWAHWLLIPVGVWLVGFGRLGHVPPLEPALQNEIVVGLLLLMFAIVPNDASRPPRAWRQSPGERRGAADSADVRPVDSQPGKPAAVGNVDRQ
jgi:hypothetical protein